MAAARAATADAIAKTVTEDPAKSLPAQVATQAEALAKAKDLAGARAAFKPLSQSLSRYLAAAKVQTGKYHQVYCSMAKAGWIQTDKTVAKPYHGSPSCNGRRMAQTAAHLADHVIPPVPVRQWVISVPKRLRCFLADRHAVASVRSRANGLWTRPANFSGPPAAYRHEFET